MALNVNSFTQRNNLIKKQGVQEGKITDYDDDFWCRLDNLIFLTVPVSLHIKYISAPDYDQTKVGKCYDRSLLMFIANKDALLVGGISADLEAIHGEGSGIHFWLELGDYVYDPSTVKKYEKEIYYQIHQPRDVRKQSWADVDKDKLDYYNSIRETKIEDYMPGGSERYKLLSTIPLLMGIAKGNEDFMNDLNAYLKKIQYDENEIYEEFKEIEGKYLAKRFK